MPGLQLPKVRHRIHRRGEAVASQLALPSGGAERGAGGVQRRQNASLPLVRRRLTVARGGPLVCRSYAPIGDALASSAGGTNEWAVA